MARTVRGSSSQVSVPGPRVKETRASDPLRSLMSGIVLTEAGTREELRKRVRLGLWPTTSRFS